MSEWPMVVRDRYSMPVRWVSQSKEDPAPPDPRQGDRWARPGEVDLMWDGEAWVEAGPMPDLPWTNFGLGDIRWNLDTPGHFEGEDA